MMYFLSISGPSHHYNVNGGGVTATTSPGKNVVAVVSNKTSSNNNNNKTNGVKADSNGKTNGVGSHHQTTPSDEATPLAHATEKEAATPTGVATTAC